MLRQRLWPSLAQSPRTTPERPPALAAPVPVRRLPVLFDLVVECAEDAGDGVLLVDRRVSSFNILRSLFVTCPNPVVCLLRAILTKFGLR